MPAVDMTPGELRVRARKNIRSAKQLLASGDPDLAAYTAGHAAELALKARYCTRHGWSNFPHDKATLKARGAAHLRTHDLDMLLRLSDAIFIARSSLRSIDLDHVVSWDSEDRYTPTGSMTNETAALRIDEVESLCVELERYEVVEALGGVEKRLLDGGVGPLNLLVFDRRADGKWRVLAAATWLTSLTAHQKVGAAIAASLPSDLLPVIAAVEACNAEHPLTHPFYGIGSVIDMGGMFHVVGATMFTGVGYSANQRPRQRGILLVTNSNVNAMSIDAAFLLVAQPPE